MSVLRCVVNSLIVAVVATILSVLLGTPAAYALARFDFRGKADLWFWFISNRMISPIVLALPIYICRDRPGAAQHLSRAGPDLSHLQPADRGVDLHRPVPLHPSRDSNRPHGLRAPTN